MGFATRRAGCIRGRARHHISSGKGTGGRILLLASVALGGLLAGTPGAALAGCTVSGGAAECRDDLPGGDPGVVDGGIEFSPATQTIDSLTVRHLLITPVDGRPGVRVRRTDPGGSLTVDIGADVTITTSGRANGVEAFASGDIDITQAGSIGVYNASGVYAASDSGRVSLLNTGDIDVGGLSIQISGLRGFSRSGSVEVRNEGTINIHGSPISGMTAATEAGSSLALYNSGSIVTTGFGSLGMEAWARGDTGTTIRMENTGELRTDGMFAHGITAWHGGDGIIEIINDGSLTTQGAQSNAVYVEAESDTVTIVNGGSIATTGPGSSGIMVAGRGSNTIDITNSGSIDIAAGADPSGTGQVVPHGIHVTAVDGSVQVTNSGDIDTHAEGVNGINVEATGDATVSINNDGHLTTWGDGANGIAVTVMDGALTVGNGDAGVIHVDGMSSTGILARSLGDGAVSVDNAGLIEAIKDTSWGIVAEGTEVTVTNGGEVRMEGDYAVGISATGWTRSVAVENTGSVVTLGTGALGISATAFGDATLVLTNSGTLRSEGEWSVAVLAQGGESAAATMEVGNGGEIILSGESSVGIQAETMAGALTIANSGSIVSDAAYVTAVRATGDTGAIDIANSGEIVLEGDNSVALAAESYGGDITITSTGRLIARGRDSTAISAYNNDFHGGISITTRGRVAATGMGGTAIDAGSDGDITISVLGGSVRGGGGIGRAISFSGSGDHLLDNAGTISARSGVAIEGDDGNETISNAGVIRGNVLLGGGQNAFDNLTGGLFAAGTMVDLGGGALNNAGVFSPGGDGRILTTRITGDLVQTADGRLVVDIDETAGQATDMIEVSGSARLAGLLVPNIIQLTAPTTPNTSLAFLVATADGGLIDDGLTVADTVGYRFGLDFRGDELYLLVLGSLTVSDLVEGAATPNQMAFVRHLEAGIGAGSAELSELAGALLLLPDEATLLAAINRLLPPVQVAHYRSALRHAADFANAMLSCRVRDGRSIVSREGQCLWLRAGARRLKQDHVTDTPGFTDTATDIAGGVQFALDETWRLGLAFGYGHDRMHLDDATQPLARSTGDRLQAGIVVKARRGAFQAATALAASWGWFDSTRYVNLPGIAAEADSSQKVAAVTARTRLAYLLEPGGAFYYRPMIDLAATYVHLGGYREHGAGAANLTVDSRNRWLFSLSPALEIGGQIEDDNGGILRPYLRAGLTLSDKRGLSLQGRLSAAPAGVPSFVIRHSFDRLYGDVAAGLTLLAASGLVVSLDYEGHFSSHTHEHAGSLKVSVPF